MPIPTMTFFDVLGNLLNGSPFAYRRAGWPAGSYLTKTQPRLVHIIVPIHINYWQHPNDLQGPVIAEILIEPHMLYVDGSKARPWSASADDYLARDWEKYVFRPA